MVEVVHTVLDKRKHATEINVIMAEDQPMVNVSVRVVGQERVATKAGVMIFFHLTFL